MSHRDGKESQMKLSARELAAMNHPLRRLFQRHLEMRLFRQLGLRGSGRTVLEIGCGAGYGAVLLSELRPARYHGIDVMPVQIAAARQRKLPGCDFSVMDATRLDAFATGEWDTVVAFGVLHHMPGWRAAIRECRRILREGGEMFVEEPEGGAIQRFDRIFRWGHDARALFALATLEEEALAVGFRITKALRCGVAGWYRWRKPYGHFS
jgi:SAM-dependent methyltransferase